MKKFTLLLGLLSTICLTACGSKNFDMSFEDALEIANHSSLQNILAQNDNFEQSFDIAGNFNSDGNIVDLYVSSNSKQNVNNKLSDSSVKFSAGITSSGETVKLDGALDIKLVDDAVYLYLSSLDLTGSNSLAAVGMIAEGFKNQWFSIPMSGLNEMPSSFSVLRDSNKLNNKVKEIVKNEGSTTYNGKFEQFNGYNAWKFSLDNEKLKALVKEYYDSINSNLEGENLEDIPELNIQNFEGYLVITGKDKVTILIENMDIKDDNTTININGYAGNDYKINLYDESGKSLLDAVAQRKGSKYDISIMLANSVSLEGTISPKISKSSIDLKFDATLTVKSDEEGGINNIIPFKGSWKYSPISEFTVDIPENAQDLSDLLSSYLGGMVGGNDYADDENISGSLPVDTDENIVQEGAELIETTGNETTGSETSESETTDEMIETTEVAKIE